MHNEISVSISKNSIPNKQEKNSSTSFFIKIKMCPSFKENLRTFTPVIGNGALARNSREDDITMDFQIRLTVPATVHFDSAGFLLI